MKKLYFLTFDEPVAIEEVADIFSADDFSVDIRQIFPHSFSLSSSLSFSNLKHSLEFYYTEEHAPRNYVVMKIKEGSEFHCSSSQ